MNTKIIAALVCITGLLNFSLVSSATADTAIFEEAYTVTPGSVFEIRNRNGKISIEGWTGDRVTVRAIKES